MSAPTRGAVRVARAAALGVTVLTIAAAAHVLAGGALPSLLVLALLGIPVSAVAVVLTGRRCGPVLLVGALAVAQVLLHQALMVLAAAQVTGGLSGQMAAHSTSSMDPAMGTVAMASAGGWSAAMTATHMVASVVTALLLARGEQALWQLLARLLPTMRRIPRFFACGPRQAPVLLSVPVLRPSLVSAGSVLRGPPRVS